MELASAVTKSIRDSQTQRSSPVIPYIPVGYPDIETTFEIVKAFDKLDVPAVELGVPFSDPLADGVTIQKASQIPLGNGVSLIDCIQLSQRLRVEGVTVPILLMGYYNPIYQYGVEACVKDAWASGVNGFIIPDLPYEESGLMREQTGNYGLAFVPLIALTSTEKRIAATCVGASGFLYCVSVTGVTGTRNDLDVASLNKMIEAVRNNSDLPIAVGFGVSTRRQVEDLCTVADAVVVGSAFVQAVEGAGRHNAVAAVASLYEHLAGD
jgi:tryptophan synthase alpha chain